MGVINSLVLNIKYFIKRSFVISKEELEFSKKYKSYNNKNQFDKVLLIPLMDDVATMKLVKELVEKLNLSNTFAIKYFYVYTSVDTKINRKSVFHFLIQKLQIFNIFYLTKLCKIYNVKKSDIVMSNFIAPKYKPTPKNRFKTKNEILDIDYKGINVGELIYDTYLRFRAKPTIDLNDDCLYDIIDYSFNLSQKWDDFLSENKIDTLLIPYTSYFHWGIPSKLAVKNNVQTLTFGSLGYILQQTTFEYPYHSKNFNYYRLIFEKLSNKSEKLKLAEQYLNNRLDGVIDNSISYMKKSSFKDDKNSASIALTNEKCAVIFLHCFFDSPHIYGSALFPDFHEWIQHVLDIASQVPTTDFIVKPHPNGLPDNDLIVSELEKKYKAFKNIIFIPKEISNKQLIAMQPKAVFTVYGTVAHEFAFLGFPVIASGKNPHSKYDFIYEPTSIDELDKLIREVGAYGLPGKYLKEDILEFYYMHYLYFSKEYDITTIDFKRDFHKGYFMINKEISITNSIYEIVT